MYYSSGNYEAFARPRKPAGVENKTAWFVGSGLAALSGAAFLIRDAQLDGSKDHDSGLPPRRRCLRPSTRGCVSSVPGCRP